ncbi:hypothetical protein [Streptomyces sp. AF1A]|jgi:hypothetical protein|uniref:hypothetical protein n=1 Tax=Streptomyces sp. AF1A TaxID=3394350 RepID=UPI0039BD4E9B
MNQLKVSSSDLPQPLRAAGHALRRLPGAEQVARAADSALDWIGAISPRGRRMAVYTSAGVLGVAGLVEWPMAVTGAAVAWLTQPHPPKGPHGETAQDERARNAEGGATGNGVPPAVSGAAPVSAAGTERYGAGDRLAASHFHEDHPARHPHEQPAKVGDPATASALKQVAKASAHHAQPDADGAGR